MTTPSRSFGLALLTLCSLAATHLCAAPGNYNQQGPKLVGAGSFAQARQGASVALSADGSTALVGAPGGAGGAWVFTRTGGVWTQQGQMLTDSTSGSVVAISADGNTAVVNAYFGASVFTRTGGMWSLQSRVAPSPDPSQGGLFDTRVALSPDGNTLAEAYLGGQGVVTSVFTRTNAAWTQQGTDLIFPYPIAPAVGCCAVYLTISPDANTIALEIDGGGEEDRDDAPPDIYYGTQGFVLKQFGGAWTSQLVFQHIHTPYENTDSPPGVPVTSLYNLPILLIGPNTLMYFVHGTWSTNGPQPSTPNKDARLALSADGSTVVGASYTYFPNPLMIDLFVKAAVGCGPGCAPDTWALHHSYPLNAGTPSGPFASNDIASVAVSANGDTMIAGLFLDNNNLGAAVVLAAPQLNISLTHSGNFQRNQIDATYTITVSNAGDRDIHAAATSAVNIVDTIPAGLVATGIQGSGWTCALATVSCTRSDGLAVDASFPPITVTVNVETSGTGVVNSATASGGGSAWSTALDSTVIAP